MNKEQIQNKESLKYFFILCILEFYLKLKKNNNTFNEYNFYKICLNLYSFSCGFFSIYRVVQKKYH